MVEKELRNQPRTTLKIARPNLTKGEIKAMPDLSNCDDIMITKADKGRAVVILDVKDDLAEVNTQLKNNEFYNKLESNLTETHTDIINRNIWNFATTKVIQNKPRKP